MHAAFLTGLGVGEGVGANIRGELSWKWEHVPVKIRGGAKYLGGGREVELPLLGGVPR